MSSDSKTMMNSTLDFSDLQAPAISPAVAGAGILCTKLRHRGKCGRQ